MVSGDDSQSGLRVLVVEDDKSVRRILRLLLRDAGFHVSEAGTGGEALERLEAGGLSGVMLDFGLPDSHSAMSSSGFTTMESFRRGWLSLPWMQRTCNVLTS